MDLSGFYKYLVDERQETASCSREEFMLSSLVDGYSPVRSLLQGSKKEEEVQRPAAQKHVSTRLISSVAIRRAQTTQMVHAVDMRKYGT